MPIINRISKFIRCYANINGLQFKDSDLLFCTISNDEFVPGTIVMIYSMKKHLPKFHKYKIRIFFDNYISPLSVKNRQLLSSLGNNIELIEIEDEVYRNARCKHEKHSLSIIYMLHDFLSPFLILCLFPMALVLTHILRNVKFLYYFGVF